MMKALEKIAREDMDALVLSDHAEAVYGGDALTAIYRNRIYDINNSGTEYHLRNPQRSKTRKRSEIES